MNDHFYQQILQNFERKSTSELKGILAGADSGEWSDDALRIAGAILAGRPDEPQIKEPPADALDGQVQCAIEPKAEKIVPNRSKIRVFAEDMKLALKFIVIPLGCIGALFFALIASMLWTGEYVTTLHTASIGWLPASAQDVSHRIRRGFAASEDIECTLPEDDFLALAERMDWKVEPQKDFFAYLRIEGLPHLRKNEIVGPVDLIHRGYKYESRRPDCGGITVFYDADLQRMIYATSDH